MLHRDRLWLMFLLAALGACLSVSARAMDLQDARKARVVCENPNGTVSPLDNAGPDVKTLVEAVNLRRNQEYARISKENNQTPDVVAKLAAVEIAKQPGVSACH
jgi:uncharacterized protein YdbL (DUF1318 family)